MILLGVSEFISEKIYRINIIFFIIETIVLITLPVRTAYQGKSFA